MKLSWPNQPLHAFVITLLSASSFCHASDRPVMTGPPAGQEAAKELAESVASACNRKDFIGFMEHFTPKQQAAMRKKMEDVFIAHELEMEIQQVVLLEDGDDRITFGVRYACSPQSAPKQMFASKVTARKLDGRWKVDKEQVRSRSLSSHSVSASDGAQGGEAIGAAWDPFNPPAHLIDPELEDLRGDIGIQRGRGCVNGRCGVR